MYDSTLLYEKNFRDYKRDKMKKLTHIWSSGLSIYGKVTIIKSLLIPKLVYASSLLPTPAILSNKWDIYFTHFYGKGKTR
jgi:prolipoprotein diacylglyceryltransferase